MDANYRGMSGMYALINDLTLLTMVQSTCNIVFIKFSGSTRELRHTFVFYKLAYCGVSIPGNEPKMD